MRRREFITLLGGAVAAWPLAVRAQQAEKVYRIGFLGNSTSALETNLVGPFREGLRDLGYVEGQNILIEYRWAEGQYERFPALIAELLAKRVEVIVTAGTPASLAVKKATTSVPLVMVAVGDPVATGLVASLARPGGNITGLTSTSEELEGKRLELLREVIPKLSHVAVFWNPENPTLLTSLKEMRAAAQVLGIKVQVLEVRTPGELEETLKATVRERPGALLVMGDRLFLHNRQRIMDFASKQRLPVVPGHPELVEAGGLMSYGASYSGMHRRAAYFVDRILKGAKPADLPVERPTKFELVINLKTANAIGIDVPPTLLARADAVIEWAANRARQHAAELVAQLPDVILASGGSAVPPLLEATRSVPIVFTLTPDPVGAGFVDSLARPGGNVTGFTMFEYGISGKWLELLKEVSPHIRRVAVVRDSAVPQGTGEFGAIQSVAPSFGVELTPQTVAGFPRMLRLEQMHRAWLDDRVQCTGPDVTACLDRLYDARIHELVDAIVMEQQSKP